MFFNIAACIYYLNVAEIHKNYFVAYNSQIIIFFYFNTKGLSIKYI